MPLLRPELRTIKHMSAVAYLKLILPLRALKRWEKNLVDLEITTIGTYVRICSRLMAHAQDKATPTPRGQRLALKMVMHEYARPPSSDHHSHLGSMLSNTASTTRLARGHHPMHMLYVCTCMYIPYISAP
jgi:hypothetical protein